MQDNHSSYYDREEITKAVEGNQHREVIGGMWDEIGELQIQMLQSEGLKSGHRLLDIGCGSLRLGVRAAAYLEAGQYWGTDLNESLLSAGYEREIIPAGLAGKLPRKNLVVDENFAFEGVPRHVDFAIAQSVFTHLPLSLLRRCLENLSNHLEGPCAFYVTVFVAPDARYSQPFLQPMGGVTTCSGTDPYHLKVGQLFEVVSDLPWEAKFIGDWGHPRNQKLMLYRLPGNPG